jgi:integrase
MALEIRRAVWDGGDPQADKATRRHDRQDNQNTIGYHAQQFLTRHVDAKHKRPDETRRIFDKWILPAWADREFRALTRRDVVLLLDEVTNHTSATRANRVLAAVRKFCRWSVARSILDHAPTDGIEKPGTENPRDRVLSRDEVKRLWSATQALNQFHRSAVRLLIVTGQRTNEIAGMTWEEVDQETRLWTIPSARAKNGLTHVVPLSDLALEQLNRLPRLDSPYVFPSPIQGKALSKDTLSGTVKQRLAKAAEIDNWGMHDLRRTLATRLSELDIPEEVIGAVLNHKRRGVTAHSYNRNTFLKQKRRALDLWSSQLAQGLFGATADVVVFPATRF